MDCTCCSGSSPFLLRIALLPRLFHRIEANTEAGFWQLPKYLHIIQLSFQLLQSAILSNRWKMKIKNSGSFNTEQCKDVREVWWTCLGWAVSCCNWKTSTAQKIMLPFFIIDKMRNSVFWSTVPQLSWRFEQCFQSVSFQLHFCFQAECWAPESGGYTIFGLWLCAGL